MSHHPTISGRVTLGTEPVPGALASNGRHVVATDQDGRFTLPLPDALVEGALPPPEKEMKAGRDPSRGSRWIMLTTPAGMRPAEGPFGWFRNLLSDPADHVEFRLAPDETRAGETFVAAVQSDDHLGKYPFSWLDEDLLAMARDPVAPSCVLCTGDMTQAGRPSELASYVASSNRSPLPVIHVPGNHEWGADRSGENWSDVVGPHHFSLDWGSVHIIAYDSTAHHYTDAYALDEWLRNDLALIPSGKPVLMLIHHQWEEDFYAPLRAHRIVASLSGHWHSSRLYHDGHTFHANQPSSTMGGIDYSARGYSVMTITADGEVSLERRLLGANGRSGRTGVTSVAEAPPHTRPGGGAVRCASPWPQFHGGPTRTGKGPDTLRLPLRRAWQTRLPGGLLFGSPVIDSEPGEERVFIASLDEERPNSGWLTCHDPATGHVLWQRSTQGSVKHAPAAGEGLVFVVNVTGRVMALRAESGEPAWEYQLGDASQRWIFSAPLVVDGKLLAGASRHFACLDAGTGEPIWVREDLGATDWISSYSSPASDGESVYVGFFWHREIAIALDLATGGTRWVLDGPTRDGPASSHVLDGAGKLYVTCHDGILRCCGAETGAIEWEFDLEQSGDSRGGPRWSAGTPALAEGRLFVPHSGGGVVAVEVERGKQLWRWRCKPALAGVQAYERDGASVLSSPVVCGKTVICGSSDGRLVGLDAENGDLLWQGDLAAPVISSPAVSGNLLVCGASDGWLYAWTGAER